MWWWSEGGCEVRVGRGLEGAIARLRSIFPFGMFVHTDKQLPAPPLGTVLGLLIGREQNTFMEITYKIQPRR